MRRIGYALGAWFLALPLAAAAEPVSIGELMSLPSRPGVTQNIFIATPQAQPKAVMLLYAGGPGIIDLHEDGPHSERGNYVIRTSSYWVDHGYAVVLVDAPSDQMTSGMDDYFRRSHDALTDQKVIVGEVRMRFPGLKVVLYGTSRGTVTEGNMLMHAPELADIYVLTSPESIAVKHPGVSDLDVPKSYRDKTMILSNEHDVCVVAAYYGAKQLADRNGVPLITESSDQSKGSECGGQSPHGFLGIEHKALADSKDWIESKLN